MTLIKHALKNLRKDIVVQALTALQLAAALVIGIIMSSAVMMRYRYYKPFRDILGSDGIYVYSQGAMILNYSYGFDSYERTVTPDKLKELFPEIESVTCCGGETFGIEAINGESVYDMTDGQEKQEDGQEQEEENVEIPSPQYIFYDEKMRSCYVPELESGRWLEEGGKAEFAEAVITESSAELDVGDTITVYNGEYGVNPAAVNEYIDIKIVGKLKENQKAIGYWDIPVNEKDPLGINHIYGDARPQKNDSPTMFLSSEYFIKNEGVTPYITNPTFITLKDGVSEERREEIRRELGTMTENHGGVLSCSFSEFRKNSLDHIMSEIKTLLPIIAVLLILVLISSISSSALAARRDMRTHAVFYITGLQWKHCSLISVIQSAMIAAVSAALAVVSLGVLINSDLGIKVFYVPETFICVPAVIAFYMSASLIMPLLIHFKTTPKQILTR